VGKNPAEAWTKLVFFAENRVSGIRIQFANVGGRTERDQVFDGYKALVSAAQTIVVPRIAVTFLEKLDADGEVKIGGVRLSRRGVIMRHRDPRRASVSSSWEAVTMLIDTDGKPTSGRPIMAMCHNGTELPIIDPSSKHAAVLPLLMWLAHDRFAQKPIVMPVEEVPTWVSSDRYQ
jgi:hypothetical protein